MSHDPNRTPSASFPRLTPTNHRITSPADDSYNCAAWAAGDTGRRWDPGDYWPLPADGVLYLADDLVRAFEAVRFVRCPAGDPEPGYERVALYAQGGAMTHAARQLPTGLWTSKLGNLEDIVHATPEAVGGGDYGEVFAYLKRRPPAG